MNVVSVMVMSCHHKPAAHELSSSRSGGGGGGGPTFYRASNHVACFGGINDAVASMSAITGAVAVTKSLQYPYSNSDSSLFTSNSSGEMTSVNERVLFTAAQLQELERQTTIYKYMVASAAVPPELLMPITKNQSNVLTSQSNSSLGLVIPSCYSPDPEPWRCKRTDGKKWRCSRDVAPDQKYCERHSHKSRPRSRKPVESNTHDFPRSMTSTINNNYSTNPQLFNQKTHFPRNLYMFPGVMASSVTSYDHPGSLEWLLKGETLPVSSNSSQEWQHLTRDVIKGYHNVNDIDREGVHSLQSQMLNDHCSMFLSPKSTALDRALNHSQTQAQVTWHFIDACPANSGRDNICNTTHVSSSETSALPQSALTILSMSSGSQSETSNEGNGSAQLVVLGSVNCLIRPQWTMTNGGSWPGGPLAEALCLGISGLAKTASNLASPCSSSCSPSADKN
ncbi:growth-regulating factor [Salix suchowensis]|nr:growth-regulating factor [Salix suchowensis]